MMTIENIETVLPGVVTAVNEDGTVDCKPSIRKVAPNGVLDVKNMTIPRIPLMKLGGSNAEISFVSSVGDNVLLVAFSRDSSRWKKDGKDDNIPSSCTGLTLNDFVAVPFVRYNREGAAKITVDKDGNIVLQPSQNGIIISQSDVFVKGTLFTETEVAAGAQMLPTGEIIDAAAIHLTTHTHGSSMGPTTTPLPG